MLMRIHLIEKYKRRDWRQLPFDEVKRFLHFLFGDNTKKSDNGIHVDLVDDEWEIRFRGTVSFYHKIVDGRPISKAMEMEADRLNKEIMQTFKVELAKKGLSVEDAIDVLKPSTGYLTSEAI